MARGPGVERRAARYQSRLRETQRAVETELQRGELHAALRLVLGYAESQAIESDEVKAVALYPWQAHLSRAEGARLRAAWVHAINEVVGAVGMWMPDRPEQERIKREASGQ